MPINAAHKPVLCQHLLACGQAWDAADHPQAAVLFLICALPGGMVTLLTKRTDTLPLHAGQISFPGGRREACDASPEMTALRESHEEIGLPPAQVEVLGRLPAVMVSSGIAITPVVGWCEALPPLIPNPHEVAAVIELPMTLALNPDHYRRGAKGTGKLRREYWFLEHDNHLVWGATASILHSLACVVRTAQTEW